MQSAGCVREFHDNHGLVRFKLELCAAMFTYHTSTRHGFGDLPKIFAQRLIRIVPS